MRKTPPWKRSESSVDDMSETAIHLLKIAQAAALATILNAMPMPLLDDPVDPLGIPRRGSFGLRNFSTGVRQGAYWSLAWINHSSIIATARVKPAEAALILKGKQETVNPVLGSASRLLSFSIWQ